MKPSKAAALLLGVMSIIWLSTASAGEVAFRDVPVTHWAYGDIQNLHNTGIIKGFPDKTFKPDQKITREQFAVILALTMKLPLDSSAPQTFSDVKPGHRSFLHIDATKWMIPTPSSGLGKLLFNGPRFITREEVAEALVLALNLDKKPKPPASFLASKFKDYNNISSTYRDQVAVAVYYGIMSGNANGTFKAKGALTRAEIAVLMNKLQKEKDKENTPSNQKPGAQTGTQPGAQPDLTPKHKPWTIEYINFTQPDVDLVRSFFGTVASKVYNTPDPHLVIEHTTVSDGRAYTKSVHVYVYEKDLSIFYIDDWVRFDYDRQNNITSYFFEKKVPRP